MERIKLDLVPGCVKPILHASQYDNDREWTCDILDNGVPYKFVSGDTCEIHVRKGDNCAVTASVPVTVGQSYVVVTSTEQMCAVSGDNLAELVIMNGTKKIGSCNLILSVEADPLNGSKSSASEIHDLQHQVDACVDEALSHKGASDIAFDNTDTGLEATNVQSAIEEVNTKTDEKADADDVYDKTYIDNAFTGVNNSLNNKMDKSNPVGTGSFSFNRREGSTVGDKSVALGDRTIASGANSFTSGYGSVASGAKSSAMGSGNRASGSSSMAINSSNTASGDYSLAQGGLCEATEYCSHAEGYSTKASGYVSHAEGQGTIANHISQHASGEFNIPDDSSNPEYSRGKYVEIVGNGTSSSNRSNARTLDWNGNETLAGNLVYNGNKSLTSEVQRLDGRIDALPEPMVFKGTLGVGGTIQTLPVASAENEGWTFKCITAGTYEGLTLKVGDTVTCFNPPNTSVYEWDISGYGDTDTDTWRAIKVNGVEKLGNGISSGSLDVVDTDNIEAEFDNDGNKLKIKTKNIYTQSEVDTLIANAVDSVLPTDSVAKSAVANFETDLAKPIEFKAYIEAVQASGTPTPSTPIPISGWSEVKVTRCGANLCNQAEIVSAYPSEYTVDTDGSIKTVGNLGLSNVLWTNKSKVSGVLNVIFVSKYQNTGSVGIRPKIIYTDGTNSVVYTTNTQDYSTKTLLTTSGKTVEKIVVDYGTNNPTSFFLDVTLDTSATTYEAYNGNTVTIALGDTYYGGYVSQDKDGKRQLIVTHGIVDLGTLNYFSTSNRDNTKFRKMGILPTDKKGTPTTTVTIGDILCTIYKAQKGGLMYENNIEGITLSTTGANIIVYDERYNLDNDNVQFKEAMNGVMCSYPLAEPIVIDLPDGEPITALNGVNNVFCDSDDTEVTYKLSINKALSNLGGGNRSVNLAKSVEEEVKEEVKDEPETRQER